MDFTSLGIQLGPVLLSYFGLILLAALATGGMVASLRARRAGQDPDLVIDILTWGLIGGVVLARLFYVLNPPPSVAAVYDRTWFLRHPFDLQIGPFAVWSGGLGMAGALLGGLLGVLLLLVRRRAAIGDWIDILAPALMVALVIAPWANLINQQMYGPPTTLPWGIAVGNPTPPFEPGMRFHPTPAYLSIWALICAIILFWLDGQRRLMKGALFATALLLYLPALFLADFLRVDISRPVFGLTGMQLLVLPLFLSALGLWLSRWGAVPSRRDVSSAHISPPDAG